jgi:hypothetical protein
MARMLAYLSSQDLAEWGASDYMPGTARSNMIALRRGKMGGCMSMSTTRDEFSTAYGIKW